LAKKASAQQAAWTTLTEHLQAGSVLQEGSPRLAEYALDNFDPKVVIERLLDPKPTYFAHKNILFAGLSAWVVAPHYPHLVKEAMILAGMSQLADLEAKKQKEFPQAPQLADVVIRIAGPGIDFYRDFYYPAGGLHRVVKARSPHLMRRSLKAASKYIGFQVEMMRICHYHAEHLQGSETFRQASLDWSSRALEDLIKVDSTPTIVSYHSKNRPDIKRTINAHNCKKKSAPYSPSATLIYAASSINLENETLLAALCRGAVSFRKHGHYLPMWLGRAIHADRKIITPMYPSGMNNDQTEFLPAIAEIEIPAPNYGLDHKIIDNNYAS